MLGRPHQRAVVPFVAAGTVPEYQPSHGHRVDDLRRRERRGGRAERCRADRGTRQRYPNALYTQSQATSQGQCALTVTFQLGTDPDIDTVAVQNRARQTAGTSRHVGDARVWWTVRVCAWFLMPRRDASRAISKPSSSFPNGLPPKRSGSITPRKRSVHRPLNPWQKSILELYPGWMNLMLRSACAKGEDSIRRRL